MKGSFRANDDEWAGEIPSLNLRKIKCRIEETQEVLDFCAEHGVRSEIEVFEIENIKEAFDRVVDGDVRFRFVIDNLTLPKSVQSHPSRPERATIHPRSYRMDIKRVGTQASTQGPAEWFTGTVRIDPLFTARDPARASGSAVTFGPGARTAWHTHPLGQTLIVTSGAGLVQREGGAIEAIHPGDVVWFPPDEKHWHGASSTLAMTHIALQEQRDGKAVDWLEHVTDEQYAAQDSGERRKHR